MSFANPLSSVAAEVPSKYKAYCSGFAFDLLWYTAQLLVAPLLTFIIYHSGILPKLCAIVPALPVPVHETILKPAVWFVEPELSIVPTLVALASLLKDVPAFQFHATLVSPLLFSLPAVPILKPSESKDVRPDLVSSRSVGFEFKPFCTPLTTSYNSWW